MMDDIDRSFDWWQNAIAGQPSTLELDDSPKAGFYRVKNSDQTHSAMAYWYDKSDPSHPLRCHLDGKDISQERAEMQWPFACMHPILEKVYWHWIENRTWLDINPADLQQKPFVTDIDVDSAFQQFRDSTDVKFLLKRLVQDTVNKGRAVPGAIIEGREIIKRGTIKRIERVPASNREVTQADNKPPETSAAADHAAGIDAAIGGALKKVTNETEAAQALGSKNRLAELRLAADKAGKALYQPPYQEYQRLYGEWNPPVKRAEAKEKELNTIILTFRESERRRVAAEQALADTKQREIEEANERAAQRAISAGEQEPPPIVEEVEQPGHLAPIAPTYGSRKLKEEVKHILDSITDYDAVYNFLKAEPKVKAVLLELATAKVKAGFTIPGVITREGLI